MHPTNDPVLLIVRCLISVLILSRQFAATCRLPPASCRLLLKTPVEKLPSGAAGAAGELRILNCLTKQNYNIYA
jgi:hypothetical protein